MMERITPSDPERDDNKSERNLKAPDTEHDVAAFIEFIKDNMVLDFKDYRRPSDRPHLDPEHPNRKQEQRHPASSDNPTTPEKAADIQPHTQASSDHLTSPKDPHNG